MVGSIVPTIAPNMATRCDDVRAEIRMPSESETRMNSSPSASSRARLPRSGTLKMSRASMITPMTDTKPIRRYGATLPTMMCHGRRGETSSVSSVPISFSRVSEMAVINDEMIVSTNAISPGTNRFELSRVGLKRMRTCGTMRIVPAAGCMSRSYPWMTCSAYAWIALPVFGSVASAMICTRAGSPCPSRAANPGSNTIASCASPRWNNRSTSADLGTTATMRKTSVAPKRLRRASVAESGDGSTMASRTCSTSVRIA